MAYLSWLPFSCSDAKELAKYGLGPDALIGAPGGVRYVFIPYHAFRSHWILVVIDHKDKKIRVLDPLNGESPFIAAQKRAGA